MIINYLARHDKRTDSIIHTKDVNTFRFGSKNNKDEPYGTIYVPKENGCVRLTIEYI
jgi:hypothetical protein